jgi:hypothetical protein
VSSADGNVLVSQLVGGARREMLTGSLHIDASVGWDAINTTIYFTLNSNGMHLSPRIVATG